MPVGHIALCGFSSKIAGLRWESDTLLRIGRQSSLEVVLRDNSVSRLHAEVKFQGQRWTLKDLADSPYYPTSLNGTNISGLSVHLKLNDVIQLGNLQLRVAAVGVEKQVAGLPRPGASPAQVAPAVPTLAAFSSPFPDTTQPGVLVMTGLHRFSTGHVAPTTSAPPASNGELQVLQIQTSTRQTWDQALEQAIFAMSGRSDSKRTMLALLRSNHHGASQANLDELLRSILADVLEALGAQRAAILLTDHRGERLELKAIHAPSSFTKGKKSYSRTLAERSFRQGESLLCRDLNSDQESRLAGTLFGSMSSMICAVLRTPNKRLGVLHLDRGPMQEPFTESDLCLADAVAANMAVAIECALLIAGQNEQFLETVTTLARTVERYDQANGCQAKRVTDFALLLADDLGLSPEERRQIRIGAPLHDIGKIGIDDAVLRKPGKLTAGEFEHVKSHTLKGAAMFDGFSHLAALVPIVRSHHERWDGSGYPDGLGRNNISLTARIVAVADTFDAMTSRRPYRPALPPQFAFLELLSRAGTHFDPHVVQSFIRLRPRVEGILRSRDVETNG